jgi:tetratricopeptide (TPR) repeat protein
MNSQTPIIRQVSSLAAIPQLLALTCAIAMAFTLGAPRPFIYGPLVYLAYSIGSRKLIPRAHRAGIRLVKQQRFGEAIPKFQQSYDFFERHPWIDRYRSIVLMSPSTASYREMALANIGFCYSQLGDGKQSRAYYQQCLDHFPYSGVATCALRMLDSVSSSGANPGTPKAPG